MNFILLFLILSIITIGIVIKFDRRFEESFILSILNIVFILFISGVFINLKVGIWLVLLETIGILIYLIIKRKKVIEKKANIFTFGALAIVLFYILIIWANYGRVISLWDEFSHWGLTVKNMFTFDEFSSIPQSTALFKDYPPATSLFQYFFMKISGTYNESLNYVAMYLMMFSFLAPLFKFINKKTFSNLVSTLGLLFLLIVLPTILYPYIYITLQVDGLIGIILGAILIQYFTEKNLDKFSYITITSMMATLVITKQVAALFVIFAYLLIFIDYFFIKNKFSWKKVKEKFIYLLIPIMVVGVTLLLWNLSLKLNGAPESWKESISMQEIFNLMVGKGDPYRYEVIKNYIVALFYQPLEGLTGSLTYIKWIAIIFITMLGCFYKSTKEIFFKTIKVLFIGLLICLALYTGVLLVLYMFKFSVWEAVRLASYTRYISSMILPILMIVFAVYIKRGSADNVKFSKIIIVLCSLCLLFININSFYELTIGARGSINVTKERRADMNIYEEITNRHLKSGDKVYFIAVDTNGGQYFIARYISTPLEINPPIWSIGKPYSEDDIWTIDITLEEWKKSLKDDNYTHVYIHKVKPQFTEVYGEIFNQKELKNDQLYKINNDTEFKLELVE